MVLVSERIFRKFVVVTLSCVIDIGTPADSELCTIDSGTTVFVIDPAVADTTFCIFITVPASVTVPPALFTSESLANCTRLNVELIVDAAVCVLDSR